MSMTSLAIGYQLQHHIASVTTTFDKISVYYKSSCARSTRHMILEYKIETFATALFRHTSRKHFLPDTDCFEVRQKFF